MRFAIHVAAHDVVGPNRTYAIPEKPIIVGENTLPRAKLLALRWAHSDAGVPSWIPYLKQSWPHVTGGLHVASKAERMREARQKR